MGIFGDFIGKSEDVGIIHSNDPSQDCMLLCIFVCVRLLCRPFFV